jgi:hypothetical protein
LIYDYRLNNKDAFPNDEYLRQYRHKLNNLIGKAREINKNQSLDVDDSFFDQDVLYQQLIAFLSDFAEQARYYNLDFLTGKRQYGPEPLARWDKEICTEVVKRHYRPNQRRLGRKKLLANELENTNLVHILHVREDGSRISNVTDLFMQDDLIPTKQKYSMYYLYTISRFLSNLLARLESKGTFYPYLSEFFMIFRCDDKNDILQTKIWYSMQ